ncbi:MAG TPA: cation:proton antiporter [Bacteroidales bacterium]|nr:cation:proton antiporter [Bacteroidales bacterium]HPS18441.1 cation:proton antiporter [Bacteroidales bacterium]
MRKNFIFYFLILFLFGTLIWLVIQKGESLSSTRIITNEQVIQNDNPTQPPVTATPECLSIPGYIKNTLQHPSALLILQIIIIITFSRIFGFLFGKIGQPTVIGEIISGILLGPSLLGLFFPDVFHFIFPAFSLNNLELFSQVGLVLFMFIIGMELDVTILKVKAKSAIIISHTSILFAFFLGVCLAYLLFEKYAFTNTNFTRFALFIGIAMSIAAFPVLARIIQERGMTKTPLGKTIITIAAIDDLTAWCILAVVVAVIQAGSIMSALFTIIMVILFIGVMLFAVQPFLQKMGAIYLTKEMMTKRVVAFIFVVIFLSAFFTEAIGIKALFGGFLAGVIMPSNAQFKKVMAEKIEDVSLVVLLPLFFVFTGLRTQIGLLSDSDSWAVCGLIILFAISGKFGGSFLAAKFNKLTWKDSFVIGTLMNTRGLMELIVLNIGYDLKILSPQVFTMMVIMTLFTTFMTGPILSLTDYFSRKKKQHIYDYVDLRSLNVLISFGLPKMGTSLLKLVYALSGKDKSYHKICALHLTPHTEISQSAAMKYETNSFAAIRSLANELKVDIKTIYKTTEDVSKEIARTSRKEKSNLLLIGAAKSVFNKNVLGGKVKNIIDLAKCNVGVFIDKDFQEINNILILTDTINIENFINISERFLINSFSAITFILPENIVNSTFPDIVKNHERIYFSDSSNINNASLKKYDLLITTIDYFENKLRDETILLDAAPSLLLLNFKDNIFSI